MGKKFVKIFSVLMTFVLTIVLALGCSGGQQTQESAGETKGESKGEAKGSSNDIKFPLAKLKTFTYFTSAASNVISTLKDYNGIEMYKELEKITNVHIDFQHPPKGQEKDNFNLMIASGKLPDMIEWNWFSVPGGPEKALKDGTIIRLNDYIEKYAPNLSKILKEHPEWRKQASTDNGDIYMFPFIRSQKELLVFQGPALRKDWLEKLGLQPPTTIDEWYTVLKTIKNGDPNGNGQADEIPLSVKKSDIDGTKVFVGAWGITDSFYQETGQVKYGPLDPRYKEFLATLNKWYKEGLLNKDFSAVDGKLMDALITGHRLGSTSLLVSGGIGRYMDLMSKKEPNFKLGAAPYPVLQKGEKPQFGQMDFNVPGQGTAITSKAKNIELAVKWLDYKYGPEGHLMANFGIEGKSYKMENGYPKYTDEILNNPQGLSLKDAMGRWHLASFSGPMVQDVRYFEQILPWPEQKEAAFKIWQTQNTKLMPNVTPNKEESSKFASLMNQINTYHDEMFNKFIMGMEPLNNFDKFVQTLKGMGIEEAIKIQQNALDRYNKRK